MPTVHNVRSLIEILLAALAEGAAIHDGVRLKVQAGMNVTVGRTAGPASRAVLTFVPPVELSTRRGPFHLRCSLTAMTIGVDEIHLAIDGWFDRRWQVGS
ncbi:MAG: hypothetical protein WBC44_20585 [Planctomycetaceae bacterium]